MGRWYVDNIILQYCRKYKFSIIDITLLMSAHQGMDYSEKHKSEMTEDDFYCNFQFYNSNDKHSGFLISNYFVVC